MSRRPRPRNQLYCVVPPYMLDGMVRRGLPIRDVTKAERLARARQARRALRTLQTDNLLRSARVALAESARPFRQAARGARLVQELAGVQPLVAARADRTIYDARHRLRLPGVRARSEGDPPTGDTEVDEAYDGLGDAHRFFWEALGRSSTDGRGTSLNASVHFGVRYDNAMWTGYQMLFGDGDRTAFERFTITVDIMGHELTHAVTEQETGLAYWGQPGALSESLSDVFGSLIKQYRYKQRARDADWLLGADDVTGLKILVPEIKGVALRSMRAPGTAFNDPLLGGKDPQPAHMDDYVHGMDDNFGVHINSGIPNHAFYLVATALDRNAYEEAGRIWYGALSSPLLTPNATFRSFAQVTLAVARREFGLASQEAGAVREAWNSVGVRL